MFNELAYLTSFLAFNKTLMGLFTKISLIAIIASHIHMARIISCCRLHGGAERTMLDSVIMM